MIPTDANLVQSKKNIDLRLSFGKMKFFYHV